MTIDTSNMSPDDIVRRFPAEVHWDADYCSDVPEGGCIAIFAVVLFALIAVGSFVAAVF